MGRAEDMTPEDALAALAWQLELGADEALEAAPVARWRQAAPVPAPAAPAMAAPAPAAASDGGAGAEAAELARAATTLEELRDAIARFEGCALKRGARNLVFSDGVPGARVMIVGEAPGREEDQQGKPFVGKSGRLLDRMLAAIGLSRHAEDPAHAVYITNTLPWRPPQNRQPSADELAMMRPFLMAHVELAAPEVLVTMGNPATHMILETTTGISRLRGQWREAAGRPVLPMFHPAALLRDAGKKRPAWADLLALKARLEGET